MDPYSQYHSPYLAMGNNPINLIDPDGGWAYGGGDDPPMKVMMIDGQKYHYSFVAEVTASPLSSNSSNSFENIQLALDIAGSSEIPILSQVSDFSSGVMSLVKGDYIGAGLSMGGIFVPGMSQAKLARNALKYAPKTYKYFKSFKPIHFRGIMQNRKLKTLTHNQIYNAFEDVGLKMSNHAIERINDPRTRSHGFNTLNDIKSIFNKGQKFIDEKSNVAFYYKGVMALVDPNTKRVITITPVKQGKINSYTPM
jgi:hypothetical protein